MNAREGRIGGGPSWGMAAIAGGGAFWKSRPVGPENGSGGGNGNGGG